MNNPAQIIHVEMNKTLGLGQFFNHKQITATVLSFDYIVAAL